MGFVPGESCTGEKVVVVGASGYIGKAVVRESVARGYPTVAVVRDVDRAKSEKKFDGAKLMKADVCDAASLGQPGMPFEKGKIDVVISCLASRTGSKKDSYAIDYQATLNCLNAARAAGARHFVLLSAFCVKSAERNDKYALQFQYAKMELEAKLREQTDMTYSIVRPTAFFKCAARPSPLRLRLSAGSAACSSVPRRGSGGNGPLLPLPGQVGVGPVRGGQRGRSVCVL
jgi:divinyl chlorophyllide a 8-vinyl-reductase